MPIRVPVAVVGLGSMGSRWARVLAEHAGAEVRVVCDVREDVGRETAVRLGARFIADPLEAAADREVVGVAVCTPEDQHVEPALAAIGAGKALVVEKPLAHSVEDAERISERARARGVPLLAGHILRFDPRYAAARRAIENGELGEVQAVSHERIGRVTDQEVLRGRTTIPLYYGVHEFDLARWYAGDIDRVYAERSEGVLRAHGYEVADLYSAVLHFTSGAHGTAVLGWSLPSRTPGFGIGGVTVIGERGLVRVSQGNAGLLVVDESGTRATDVYYAPDVHGRLRGALAIEADHFVAVARGDVDPLCTGEDGSEAVRVSLGMEASAQRAEPVPLAQLVR